MCPYILQVLCHTDPMTQNSCQGISVNSPCNLLEGESTGSFSRGVRHQRAAVEDQDGDMWAIGGDGHDAFVRDVEAVAHIQLSQDL